MVSTEAFSALTCVILAFQGVPASSQSPFDVVRVPQGEYPLLYRPGVDPVINLDDSTFDSVVLDDRTRGTVVNFYVDSMAASYTFARHYLTFAASVASWHEVLVVAAVNCAEASSVSLCGNQDASALPQVVYFPQISGRQTRITLEAVHSAGQIREQVAAEMMREVAGGFGVADSKVGFVMPLKSVNDTADFIIFEKPLTGKSAAFLLDFLPYLKNVDIRRSDSKNLLLNLRIPNMPWPIIADIIPPGVKGKPSAYSFSDETSIQRYLDGSSINRYYTGIGADDDVTAVDCDANADTCRPHFRVSEAILIKTLYTCLKNEVPTVGRIEGVDFVHLRDFVNLLADYFPVATTFKINPNEVSTFSKLERVLEDVSPLLEELKELVVNATAMNESSWETAFSGTEGLDISPEWSYCTGTSSTVRGYPCGLWTLFHAVIANVYIKSFEVKNFDPVKPLQAIRGIAAILVSSCNNCGIQFDEITTYVYPLNKFTVKNRDDMLLYLWHVHNIFNQRLKGDETEDPQFPKQQFPPRFLCQVCHSGGKFSREKVRDFLLAYYTNIVPLE